MKPSATDLQIFSEMKQAFQDLGFPIRDEGRLDKYLFFGSRFFKDRLSSGNDLSISYEMKKMILRICHYFAKGASTENQRDLFDISNYITITRPNVSLEIDPKTRLITLYGEMALFAGQRSSEDRKKVILHFFSDALELLPMITDFLNGNIKKEDIINKLDTKIESRQEEVRKSEDQVDRDRN